MSENEKKIIKKISEVIPKIKEQDRGYLLGTAEQMARDSDKTKNHMEKTHDFEEGGEINGN